MQPRLDAVEEVTVTAAASGADTSGQGSTQIRFTTKSGSNSFSGSSYYYYQHEKLNTNTYFNKVSGLPKNAALQRQPGTRVGGPVFIPGLYDGRGKAFFFVNYEENRTPRTITTNSNILTAEAQAGIFRYMTASGLQTVNLYAARASLGTAGQRLHDDAGPDDRGHPERHAGLGVAGHARGARRQLHRAAAEVPAGGERPDAVPDDPHGLQPVAGAPADRLVELQRPRVASRHDEHAAGARSRAPPTPARRSPIATRSRRRCGRRSRAAS